MKKKIMMAIIVIFSTQLFANITIQEKLTCIIPASPGWSLEVTYNANNSNATVADGDNIRQLLAEYAETAIINVPPIEMAVSVKFIKPGRTIDLIGLSQIPYNNSLQLIGMQNNFLLAKASNYYPASSLLVTYPVDGGYEAIFAGFDITSGFMFPLYTYSCQQHSLELDYQKNEFDISISNPF